MSSALHNYTTQPSPVHNYTTHLLQCYTFSSALLLSLLLFSTELKSKVGSWQGYNSHMFLITCMVDHEQESLCVKGVYIKFKFNTNGTSHHHNSETYEMLVFRPAVTITVTRHVPGMWGSVVYALYYYSSPPTLSFCSHNFLFPEYFLFSWSLPVCML